MEEERIKCGRCKVLLPCEKFNKKRSGDYMKRCRRCNDITKKYAEKHKCEHGRSKYQCKECGGSSLCVHGRQKSNCKECGGSSICEHEKVKTHCKECRGSAFCDHGRKKSQCKECGGSGLCAHDRQKSNCKECGGSNICEHGKQRTYCKECGGPGICEHNRNKYLCKECGGSGICEHGRQKPRCKECEGSEFCCHGRRKYRCPECDPIGHLVSIVRCQVYNALKNNKKMRSQEYLGCTIEEFKEHIESCFAPDMSWDNYGKEWHIDHIVPIKYKENGVNPSLEEVAKRLHYMNTKPMWASENMSKSNRFYDI